MLWYFYDTCESDWVLGYFRWKWIFFRFSFTISAKPFRFRFGPRRGRLVIISWFPFSFIVKRKVTDKCDWVVTKFETYLKSFFQVRIVEKNRGYQRNFYSQLFKTQPLVELFCFGCAVEWTVSDLGFSSEVSHLSQRDLNSQPLKRFNLSRPLQLLFSSCFV